MRAALQAQRDELGNADAHTPQAMNQLGIQLAEDAPREAESLYRECRSGRLAKHGPAHKDITDVIA